MIKAGIEWDLPIGQVAGNRVGNTFARAGFFSLRSLADYIEKNGIRCWGSGEFALGGQAAPYIRMAGPKTWNAVLELLAKLGFDWHDFIWTNNKFAEPKHKPLAQLIEEISLAVSEVQKSLEEIQTRLEEPG